MTKPQKPLVAEERQTGIARAVADWKRLLTAQAEPMAWRGGHALWNEANGYWAFFGKSNARTKLGWRYWNTFGDTPKDLRNNMLVEINPPQAGPAKGTQGLFATGHDGRRWILHGGRLHPSDERVSIDRFIAITGRAPVPVVFSNGIERPYLVVAPLDQGVQDLHRQLSAFIADCRHVRTVVYRGTAEADLERKLRKTEGSSNPEKGGRYIIPARASSVAERIHGEVWQALIDALDERGVETSNARVGRHGPDLRTLGKKPTLFEIKTDTSAKALYEALGQLLLYEKLLGASYIKVMVLPDVIPPPLGSILKAMDIAVLTYRPAGRRWAIDTSLIDRWFGKRR